VPLFCEHCETALPEKAGPNDPEPTWHQYAELPKAAAVVTEYQDMLAPALAAGTSTTL
jgi:hypothetical protein